MVVLQEVIFNWPVTVGGTQFRDFCEASGARVKRAAHGLAPETTNAVQNDLLSDPAIQLQL